MAIGVNGKFNRTALQNTHPGIVSYMVVGYNVHKRLILK
jgi:hypothetical protein